MGSSIDLGRRFRHYFNFNFLTRPHNSGMLIIRALLKHGYSNFKLEIMEYCSVNEVISREQFYLYSLSPDYNILNTAGNSTGYKHTEESLEKIKKHLTKINQEKGLKVTVHDTFTNQTSTFLSIRKAAEEIGCAKNALHYIDKQQIKTGKVKLLKGRYIIKVIRS